MDIVLNDVVYRKQFKEGDNNGGLTSRIYIAFKDDVLKTTPASKRIIKEKTQLVPGVNAVFWDVIMDTAQLGLGMEGETAGKTITGTPAFEIPGMTGEILEEIDKVKNDKVVVWVVDNNARTWQIGDELFEATLVEGQGGSGQGTAGKNFTGMSFKSIAIREYRADLPIANNALTGVVFGTPTTDTTANTVTLPWTNNTGTGNAKADDEIFVLATNTRTKHVVTVNFTNTRADQSSVITFTDLQAGDKVEVSAYFRDATGVIRSPNQFLPEIEVA